MINSFPLLLKRSLAVAIVLFQIILVAPLAVQSQAVNNSVGENKSLVAAQTFSAYLFVYFTGNDKKEEAIRFALSNDGYHFWALNGDKPIISSEQISSTGGVRDPHILRGRDGKTFYMVATDMVSANGWNSNRAMVLLKSIDLVHWTSSVVNIQKKFPGNDSLLRVWAPQTIYDPVAGKYMIYFSMKHGNEPDKIYYAYANADFTDLETEPKQLLFNPTNGATIDGDIVEKDGKYYLFFKTESEGAGIKIATSDKLTGGYTVQDKYVQQTKDPVEGSGVFKLNDGSGYILMYDVYTKGKYQFTKSTDLQHFTVVDNEVSMNFHPRHGTVMPITDEEANRIETAFYNGDDVVGTAQNSAIHHINIQLDTATSNVYLPVHSGTKLQSFNPGFTKLPGVTVVPKGSADFSKGAVAYTIQVPGHDVKKYSVHVVVNNNPLFGGYYADPEVLYAKKTGRYYIYPTSDGFTGWSGNYFKTFSSPDLVNWKDEGVILDLTKDVTWANRNAWAPTIIERKIDGKYKYFYYFCAAQKIGVAVADNSSGPFVDSGKPLIASRPKGVKGGQEIDPDVFEDPVSGKVYLYWGNGYMAVAELNKDLVSIDTNAIRIITPDATFREGTEVAYRKGKYYIMWSEDDTRSPNYRVRYGYSDSPTGKITIPENNIVIEKDTAQGIYATGHNSVLNIPGTDDWYIIYHRFTIPKGITMGGAAGYNREVCIDRLYFNNDRTIKQVTPTLKGITKPVLPFKR
jgi:arabinoxylan arabinofuranohydrolase